MLSRIKLTNVKIHKRFTLDIKNKITILHGANGIGKTSILEAISLFTQGKGIFNSDINDMIAANSNNLSTILTIDNKNLQLNYTSTNKQKDFILQNNKITSKTIMENIKIFGLSPYPSLAFWHDIDVRRKIINRIILQYVPEYSIYYKNYSNALKKRNFLIKNNTFNQNWSAILDPILQKNGLMINTIRKNVITKHINQPSEYIQQFLEDTLLIELEPNFEDQTNILNTQLPLNFQGPHISKFNLTTKNQHQTSTGQRRKLLLSLLIMNATHNSNSILLLDDIFHNLDDQNIIKLLDLLKQQNIQTIITHTAPIDHEATDNIEITPWI